MILSISSGYKKWLPGMAIIISVLGIFCCGEIKGQDTGFDSLFSQTLREDSLLLEELLSDSTFSILDLIDSLIQVEPNPSSLSLRISYTSNVAYAGRNFGFQQYGLAAGASYYHKTGLYADVSGFWNSDISPRYNPTITTLGYLGNFGRKISYMVDYDHYFYQKTETDELEVSYPLTNALNGSLYYDMNFLSPGIDYSFMFGDETAHRIRGNLIGRLRFYKAWIFDRISISPAASVLAGNQNIYTYSQSYQLNREQLYQDLIDSYGWLRLIWLKRNNPERYRQIVRAAVEENSYLAIEETGKNVFGIMNYSFSLPVYFTINHLTVAVNYSINFPVALPGEEIEYDPNSYFGISLLYNLIFK